MNSSHSQSRAFSPRRLLAQAVLSIPLAFNIPWVASAQDYEIVERRMAQPRNDPADLLDRPRVRERSTHRGWEVFGNNYTIVCASSREDALLAARHFELAWSEGQRLLDPWTSIHKHRDFGLGAAEVTIDTRPPRRDGDPTTSIQPIGAQMIVCLNVGAGQPSLSEQLPLVQTAAVHSLLHSAHVNRALPSWVCEGLAVYAASKCQDSVAAMRNVEAMPTIDAEYWKRARVERHRLQDRSVTANESVAQVRFLLEGYDCRHAPAFFDSLRQTLAEARPGLELETRGGTRNTSFRASTAPAINSLMEALRPDFERWKTEPLALQPMLALADSTNPEMLDAQEEMSVVLKLARRFNSSAAAGAERTETTIRPKVVTFNANGPQDDSAPSSLANFSTPQRMLETLSSPNTPLWATLDSRGRLVLSSDAPRLAKMFDLQERRLTIEHNGNRLTLIYRLPNGRELTGWLEDNPQIPQRPIAKFAIRDRGIDR